MLIYVKIQDNACVQYFFVDTVRCLVLLDERNSEWAKKAWVIKP